MENRTNAVQKPLIELLAKNVRKTLFDDIRLQKHDKCVDLPRHLKENTTTAYVFTVQFCFWFLPFESKKNSH